MQARRIESREAKVALEDAMSRVAVDRHRARDALAGLRRDGRVRQGGRRPAPDGRRRVGELGRGRRPAARAASAWCRPTWRPAWPWSSPSCARTRSSTASPTPRARSGWCRARDGHLRIEIVDDGRGLPPDFDARKSRSLGLSDRQHPGRGDGGHLRARPTGSSTAAPAPSSTSRSEPRRAPARRVLIQERRQVVTTRHAPREHPPQPEGGLMVRPRRLLRTSLVGVAGLAVALASSVTTTSAPSRTRPVRRTGARPVRRTRAGAGGDLRGGVGSEESQRARCRSRG